MQSIGTRIIKVDHAGEHGAVNIYRGQIFAARLTAPAMLAELREFQSHEERHRAIFLAELQRRGARPCVSVGLCAAGGLLLGVISGLLGRRAIAATTVAVERVVLRHLEHQMQTLKDRDALAVRAIAGIVADERLHHDRSRALAGEGGPWVTLLLPVVAMSTEAVIWLGMRL